MMTYATYILNRIGPKTDPCGTPLTTSDHSDSLLFKTTFCFLPTRKFLIHSRRFPDIPQLRSLETKRLWGTESKALEKSKYKISTQ